MTDSTAAEQYSNDALSSKKVIRQTNGDFVKVQAGSEQYTAGITHSLGQNTNTLGNANQRVGQQASLNMSGYGGYYRDSSLNDQLQLGTLGKNGALNLSCLLRQNLLEEDGIEDLHFYFVSFNQHKQQIMEHQKNIQKRQKEARNRSNPSGRGAVGGRPLNQPLSCGSPTPSHTSNAISPMSQGGGIRGLGTAEAKSDRKTIESYRDGDENEDDFFFS